MSHLQKSETDPTGSMGSGVAAENPPATPEAEASVLQQLGAQTPWWGVSAVFHGLVIVLVGLVSFTISMPEPEEQVMVISPGLPPTASDKPDERPEVDKDQALIPAKFDPSRPESNIYVSEEFQRMAVESNIFEMNTPQLEDTHSAPGTADAKAFFMSDNPTDKAGGGGSGGSSFAEDLIGSGGPGRSGYGGWGMGGKGGEGVNPGGGKGSFSGRTGGGRRNAFIRYNPREAGRVKDWDDSVKAALEWLAYHQEADGHWDVKKYSAGNKNDTAITSLALLAFLGYGHTEKIGEHKDTVRRAVAWLIAHQNADGSVSDPSDDQAHQRRGGYPIAMSTMALVESAGMSNIPATREAAQRAVNYCVNVHQYGEGYDRLGWRYAPKSPGDLSVTGWFIMALKSAKIAHLNVDPTAIEGALKFIESVEIKDKDSENGTGYGPVSHFKYMPNNEHAGTAHRLTAIGTLARQFMGWKKDELQGSVEWFVAKGGMPEYGGNGEKVDLYYWYYGSMAVFQQGKPLFEQWGKAMLNALLPNQRKQGDERGSWDPSGEYAGEWGRVGQTALSALCLEVYYRFPQVNK